MSWKKRKASGATSDDVFEKHSDIPYTPPITSKPVNLNFKQHKFTASTAHPKPSSGNSNMTRFIRRRGSFKGTILLALTLLLLFLYKTLSNTTISSETHPPSTPMLITSGVLTKEDPRSLLHRLNILTDRTTVHFNRRNDTAADVDAIVHLRHRADNLPLIVANLCSNTLSDVIRTVTVYNNNPLSTVTHDDMATSQCPLSKLKVVNDYDDGGFGQMARYELCASADPDSRYCFIQDDKHILPPSVIRSMRFLRDLDPHGSPIVPASSEGYIQARWEHCLNAPDLNIHTCAYSMDPGALLSTRVAESFLRYMQQVGVDNTVDTVSIVDRVNGVNMVDVTNSASTDSYYSILSNSHPSSVMVVVVPSLCDLMRSSGEDAAAVMTNAKVYGEYDVLLDSLTQLPSHSSFTQVKEDGVHKLMHSVKAIGDNGLVLLSNLQLLPFVGARDSWNGTTPFAEWIEYRRKELGEERKKQTIESGYGAMLDGNSTTYFKSFGAAMMADFVGFKVPSGAHSLHLAVDSTALLALLTTQYSQDGLSYFSLDHSLHCQPAKMHTMHGNRLFECSVPLVQGFEFVRFIVTDDVDLSVEWSINEAWLGWNG
ncbi:hypothetical protein E3P77_03892 [Wallemia ichthyophaga]|uniref:Uncharacterized protein n=2 Tax=Wallemia ichthyophaga TaxID=245174 RepID=A0A4T0EU43_WALIC|nr:uncharacterized protein J056_001650 [Wallemia ichthyophaga EXF-994]TIA68897.1 hypothetical protein E3P91_03876 [Wallemia ichthyophaga]EOQ99565.1 hypothetical protein J056_001650 [Wallemia ichthyophaga EXF-994]TIA78440.1 hypothetical protein E3P98_03840 [Wallemia ichthyophaga]TIA87611.1 hypothetical protein E3P97_03874 [Wallemia ichthyophaga]TIB28116.1 hypothetical protein E3P85_03839 [Wallemia ichthyophaga]